MVHYCQQTQLNNANADNGLEIPYYQPTSQCQMKMQTHCLLPQAESHTKKLIVAPDGQLTSTGAACKLQNDSASFRKAAAAAKLALILTRIDKWFWH